MVRMFKTAERQLMPTYKSLVAVDDTCEASKGTHRDWEEVV